MSVCGGGQRAAVLHYTWIFFFFCGEEVEKSEGSGEIEESSAAGLEMKYLVLI